MGVVSLVGMRHDAVGKRRIDGRRLDLTADHARFLGACLSLDIANGEAAGRQRGAGNHRGDGIEDVMPSPERNVVRQFDLPRLSDVLG
jgi:hypothetical protein